MSYPDPFEDKSPWEETPDTPSDTPSDTPAPATLPQEKPMTDGNKVRVTLKGGSGYDAPWVTIDGTSVADALAQLNNKDVVKDLVDAAAKVGRYFASTGKPAGGAAPKKFEGGKVVSAGDGEHQGDTTCVHGQRTYRSGSNWEAMFCPAREKSEQCPPAWKDKKSGRFAVKD